MRFAPVWLLLAVFGASGCGCGDDEGDDGHGDADADTDTDTGSDVPTPCAPSIAVTEIDRILDPKLGGEPGAEITALLTESGNPVADTVYHLAVEVTGPAGPVATLAESDVPLGEQVLRWDGKNAGAFADPGTYAIHGTLSCTDDEATFDETVYVVRLGVSEIRFLAGTGERLPLLYPRFGGVDANFYPPPLDAADLVRGSDDPAEATLDLPSGVARPFDAPWGDTDSPPIDAGGGPELDHYNLPIAITAGGLPEIEIVLGDDAITAAGAPVSVGWPITDLPIRPHPTGWSFSSPDAAGVAPGEATYLVADAPVSAGVAKTILTIETVFEYQDGGAWHPIRGADSSTHVVYTLVGESTVWPDAGRIEPYIAWVPIADAVARKVAGATGDAAAVAGQVVHLVFEDLGLTYDVESGASFYTTYPGWDFSGAAIDMTAFLARANGDVVNCSDCASLVSTYANMVGCDLRYNIIGYNFALNYIRAIGTDAFTNDPFGTGFAGGFSYHAVTSPDDAGTIFDATLELDEDDSPESAPFDERIVDGVDGAFYLDHLSPQSPRYEYDEKTDIR